MLSFSLPMQEEDKWVQSSMTWRAVSFPANLFSLAKALACPTARQMTIFRFTLLLFSLGRSNFCNWAKEELIFWLRMASFTSAFEPSTRIFRVVFPPVGDNSLPFLKQVCRIAEEHCVAMTRTVRKMTEKIKVNKRNFEGILSTESFL